MKVTVYLIVANLISAPDVQKMILGNKCDMNDKRVVSKERGEHLALEYGIRFMETSAKNSHNVEEAFYILSRDIKAHIDKKLEGKDNRMLPNQNQINLGKQKNEGSSKTGWFSKCSILWRAKFIFIMVPIILFQKL